MEFYKVFHKKSKPLKPLFTTTKSVLRYIKIIYRIRISNYIDQAYF